MSYLIIMTEEKQHKFYNKFEISYHDAFQLRFKTLAEMGTILIEKIGKEEALKELEKYGENEGIELVQNLLKRFPVNNFDDFKKAFLGLLNAPSFQNGLKYNIVVDSDKELKLKVTKCLWSKVFNDLNKPEIGYCAVCHADFVVAETFHPKIKLTRTKTLMQGNDQCDHTYTWEE